VKSSAIGKRYLQIITLEVGIQARIHVSTVTLVISSQQPSTIDHPCPLRQWKQKSMKTNKIMIKDVQHEIFIV
jgi:hypothetical protein